jgi:hypothetical protein
MTAIPLNEFDHEMLIHWKRSIGISRTSQSGTREVCHDSCAVDTVGTTHRVLCVMPDRTPAGEVPRLYHIWGERRFAGPGGETATGVASPPLRSKPVGLVPSGYERGARWLASVLIVFSSGCEGRPDPRRAPVQDPADIDLVLESEISDAADGVDFGDAAFVLRDGRQRIFVPLASGTEIAVFDATGVHIQTFGRQGEGPGEFQAAAPVASDAADSVWIWDPIQRRASVFSPALEMVRTTVFLYHPRAFLPDGTLLVTETVRHPDLIGFPAHRVGRDGTVLSSFGQTPPEYRPD